MVTRGRLVAVDSCSTSWLVGVATDEGRVGVGSLGVGVQGSPGNVPGLKTGVHISLVGSDTKDLNMMAVGVGLQVNYAPPSLRGLGMLAAVNYAPDVFAFMDAESYLETSVGLFFNFMPTAALTLSYNNLLVDFEDFGDVRLDESVRLGVRLRF